MKKVMIGIFLLMACIAGLRAQDKDTVLAGILPVDDEGMIKYQGVVEVKDLSKEKLYNKGIEWINTYFPNPSSVTKKRSPENGLIEGEHSIRLTDEHDGVKVPSKTVIYKFKLEFKDGRYRYTITDFTLKAASRFPLERWLDKNGPYYDINNKPYLLQIKATMEDMISGMTAFMTKPEKAPDDDW